MNRIGRRTAYAMLANLVVAIVWQVLGSLQVVRVHYSVSGVRVGEDFSSLRSSC
jgi:hypothetical protein